MIPIQPVFTVPGDTPDGSMAAGAWIFAFDHHRVIWQAGHLKGSKWCRAMAKLKNVPDVGVDQPTFALATFDGKVRDVFTGSEADLPEQFQEVMRAHLIL